MVSFFLWWKMIQPVGVALVMDRASVFVNFAVVQIDWLETDGTQEGLISAHEHSPKCGNYASGSVLPASEKIAEHDPEFYIHRYRKSPDVDPLI